MLLAKNIFSFKYWKVRKQLLYQSEVFCMAPWVHQYMFPDGRVYPCCLSAQELDENLGDLSKGDTLEEIWNNERTVQLRVNMINGIKSKICDGCYKYEKLGKESSRLEFNKMYSHHFEIVYQSMNTDGVLPKYDLKSLDFRFSNICNLKCRSCSHYFSSKWFEESNILGNTSGQSKSIIRPVEDIESLWNQVKKGLGGLERIHFAGGEPLMMEEHYLILEHLIQEGKTNVFITYNTNFAEFSFKQYDVVQLWKKFRYVTVLASLDAMGEKGEYMRKGLDWNKVIENRKRLQKEAPHVKFQLTPTVSNMNVLHLPDFYEEWYKNGWIGETDINVYVLFEPYFYNVATLPDDLKLKVENRYHKFFEDNNKRFSKSTSDYLRNQFQVVLTHMRHPKEEKPLDYYNGHDFTSYNRVLDNLRGEDFQKVFPELKDLYH